MDLCFISPGIPIGTSPFNVSLAREFPLPKRVAVGHWQNAPRECIQISNPSVFSEIELYTVVGFDVLKGGQEISFKM